MPEYDPGASDTDLRNPKSQSILNAATRLFMRVGYGATSMDSIARAAGVSKVTVYSHFASKERLFSAIIARESARMLAKMSFPDVERLPLRDALIRIAQSFLDLLMTPRVVAIFRVVIAEIVRFPELGEVFYAAGPNASLNRVADYLQHATARGALDVPEPRLAAAQFLGMLRGDIHLRALLGLEPVSHEHIRSAVEKAVGVFLRAYAAP